MNSGAGQGYEPKAVASISSMLCQPLNGQSREIFKYTVIGQFLHTPAETCYHLYFHIEIFKYTVIGQFLHTPVIGQFLHTPVIGQFLYILL